MLDLAYFFEIDEVHLRNRGLRMPLKKRPQLRRFMLKACGYPRSVTTTVSRRDNVYNVLLR
jgi:hypothetical protein